MCRRSAVLCAAAIFAVPLLGRAQHDPHAHGRTLMGAVIHSAADHIMITTTGGREVHVAITEITNVVRGLEPISGDDISTRARVVITLTSEDEPYVAQDINVGKVDDNSDEVRLCIGQTSAGTPGQTP
jgi:hypothetical protein